MDEFRFGKPIKICGTEYWADMGTKEKQARRLVILNKTAKQQKEEDSPEKAERILEYSKELIDLALGDGAFDEIFSGRVILLRDVTALLNFIQEHLA